MTEEKNKTAQRQQLVVFNLSSEEYAVTITQVQEIIRLPEITRVPNMPNFVEGVINLRGKIIPVIDLRKRFNLQIGEHTDKNRIIVADAAGQTIGLIVDGVSEVITLSNEQIDPIPPTIASIDTEYLQGVGKLEKRLVILLDLKKVLTDIEKAAIKKIEETQQKN